MTSNHPRTSSSAVIPYPMTTSSEILPFRFFPVEMEE